MLFDFGYVYISVCKAKSLNAVLFLSKHPFSPIFRRMAAQIDAPRFREIVEQIFNRWSALKICVEHGMGGRNSHQVNIWPNLATSDQP